MSINEATGAAATSETVVIGVFEARVDAERAIEQLHAAGFGQDDIGFLMRESAAEASPAGVTDETKSGLGIENAAIGVLSGSLAGGVIGALLGMMIPGYGAAIAAGFVGGVLMGGTGGGLLGVLAGLGVSEADARYYQEEFEQHRALVTVRARERRDQVIEILRGHGARNLTTQRAAAVRVP